MSLFEAKTICILGRQPELGLAELESIYGADHLMPIGNQVLLDIPADYINFSQLGGTIKTARILDIIDTNQWSKLANYLIEKVPPYVKDLDEGKFTLGLSLYGLNVPIKQIEACLLEIKKQIKKSGRPVRIVPNKASELNSAQVLHNKLTHKGAWELLFIKNGDKTYLAQTLFVQDIEAYAGRDQARPARDSRVGMLPPKLAQIMVNLAIGQFSQAGVTPENIKLLDPFCGTGVILQEALLMGYSVIGSDIDERMVEYSQRNIRWLFEKYSKLEASVDIETADATSFTWPGFSSLASEVYLGRPLNSLPPHDKLKEIVSDTDLIIRKFLKNLAPQLKSGQALCLAVPAWRKPNGELIQLPLLAKLTDMGYTYWDLKHVPLEQLVYFRENQVVARRLLRLKKT